jgi:phosphatidylserine/phosphatidylglycerophosphate/cardiolipin synthase-like enzyme
VISANDEAFLSKLEMVNAAKSSIDAAYYIYSDDSTSSALSSALISAARRGVRVRLLLDYSSTYKDLDLFSMLEREGSSGLGNLEVRLYNRPTRNIVMDAAYLTLACGDAATGGDEDCSDAKLSAIAEAFDAEVIDNRPAAEMGISNLNVGSSGVFLSGLYSKQPELMAFALLHGRSLTSSAAGSLPGVSAENIRGVARLARIYWLARTGGPFQRLVARIKLGVVSVIYDAQLDALHQIIAQHLPIERRNLAEAVRDWDHVTDYLHQKLLLVDGTSVQLGGRNIEDTYHLTPMQRDAGLLFMDTEIRADLTSGGEALEVAFERLWNFRTMVATLPEARAHAPNEFAANIVAVRDATEACEDARQAEPGEECFMREFGERVLSRAEREMKRYAEMRERATKFRHQIQQTMRARAPSTIEIDTGAQLAYIENIPFRGGPDGPLQGRSYGAIHGKEAWSGKRINALILAGMENACRTASEETPLRVIINNAYFFPPSGLTDMLARMLDGSLDCRHVNVTILTNSRKSTDLAVTNLFARHIAYAFSDYLRSVRDPTTAASFDYFEIQDSDEAVKHSLHSKVWVLAEDMLVGSANADVRSYMMDANNAIIIRQAPAMLHRYVAMIDEILVDPARCRNLSDYYLSTPREQVIAEDRETFRSLVAAIDTGGWLNPEQRAEAEQRFVAVLDLIYTLTLERLEGVLNTPEAKARFDRIFKLI